MLPELEQNLDPMLRGGGLALLLLLALRLLQPPHQASRLLCLGLVSCTAGYLLSSGSFGQHLPAALQVPLRLLDSLAPTVFWLLGQNLFNDSFRWRPLYLAPLPLIIGLSLLIDHAGLSAPVLHYLLVLQQGLAGLMAAHVIWLSWHQHGADLLIERRNLRLWLGPGIGVYIIAFQLLNLGVNVETLPYRDLIKLAGIALFALWISLRLENMLELLSPQTPRAQSPGAVAAEPEVLLEEKATLERLRQAMDEQQLWRRESLSVADLASHLGVAEYRLRRLINGSLGQRNFNAYLNQFRIQAACEQLADPARRRLPVLSIALDVGFASITPFNRAFRAQLGMTPSEFRRQRLGAS
ncbi:helix-turn-helix domain-containing protein [Pseudomonas sp. N040]|uniref:helix-turn-helix domain-containing protein n=1 Tax=Pseudomonas sp. N040 TaxID=2785325 RepID=UPI0018A2A30D|nr:AraC family transcriptional regulator [Pseudomonas sp. N040]MBF7730939.1 helix-turn-helix transcriptional regulator [Pseudomonas sp. N040]MBW7014582.1 AraC family transcriptional regulator [Pseudomonas sp. N040]